MILQRINPARAAIWSLLGSWLSGAAALSETIPRWCVWTLGCAAAAFGLAAILAWAYQHLTPHEDPQS